MYILHQSSNTNNLVTHTYDHNMYTGDPESGDGYFICHYVQHHNATQTQQNKKKTVKHIHS